VALLLLEGCFIFFLGKTCTFYPFVSGMILDGALNNRPSELFFLENTSANFHVFVIAEYILLNIGTAVLAE